MVESRTALTVRTRCHYTYETSSTSARQQVPCLSPRVSLKTAADPSLTSCQWWQRTMASPPNSAKLKWQSTFLETAMVQCLVRQCTRSTSMRTWRQGAACWQCRRQMLMGWVSSSIFHTCTPLKALIQFSSNQIAWMVFKDNDFNKELDLWTEYLKSCVNCIVSSDIGVLLFRTQCSTLFWAPYPHLCTSMWIETLVKYD